MYPEFSGPMITWPYLSALPEAAETLAALSKGYHLALAINAEDSDEGQIRAAMRQVRLEPYIEEVFCTRRLGYHKPKPEYFLSPRKITRGPGYFTVHSLGEIISTIPGG